MLCEMPVAMPVIYTLTGIDNKQGCVIERLETTAQVRDIAPNAPFVSTANHFTTDLNGIGAGWLPRTADSLQRLCHARTVSANALATGFDWFVPPIANTLSRLAMVADAQTGYLRVLGTHGSTAVTEPFILPH
jgi:hypothetical protein